MGLDPAGVLTGRYVGLTDRDRPSACIVHPEEVVGGQALQLKSMGRDAGDAELASRVLVRLQRLLDPEAVVTPVLDGIRGPAESVRLVP